MKTEHYNKLVEVVGKEKADKIKDAMIEAELRRKDEDIKEANRLIRMVAVMIPKETLIDGAYYNGHRWRAGHVAKWDATKGKFLCINFTMGEFYLEDLPYFADVAETRLDGFLPFEMIKKIEIE